VVQFIERPMLKCSHCFYDEMMNMSDHPLDLSHLTDAELLAMFLTSENAIDLASHLLTHYDGLHGLMRLDADDLQQIEGVDSAAAAQILAVFELGKRLFSYRADERPLVTSAVDAARLVADMTDLRQEHVRVILLDLTRRVIAIPTIYIGTLNASVLRTAEVFREAITHNCPAMILVHNHPAGDSSPSPEDVELTHILIAAAKLLDIILIDHLIISRSGWSSLKEVGLAFNSSG
jgi:DNA repair protein RadC